MFVQRHMGHGDTLYNFSLINSQRSRVTLSHILDIDWMNARFLYYFFSHHPGSSQTVSIYRWEIEAKISVSVSISRLLGLRPVLYSVPDFLCCGLYPSLPLCGAHLEPHRGVSCPGALVMLVFC